MRTFDTHQDFELYWTGKSEAVKPAGFRSVDHGFLVWFSASWCGPCKRLDMDAIEAAAKVVGVPLWKVEQTVNDYTAGFCNVRALPTFAFMIPRKINSTITSCVTEDVVAWITKACILPKPETK